MREDDDEFRHYVPLLRRIIILVAVITAVPVVLWTITVFVRTYVGPPRIPTFHQLASTASINAPAPGALAEGTAQLQAAMQAKLASQSAPTTGDARDAAAAPKGSLLSDRAPDGDANAAAQAAPKTADTSGALLTAPRSATAAGDNVFPPSPLAPPDNAAPGSISTAAAEAQPEAAMDLPPAPPLTGPVPMPRHRPHNIDAVRTADITPSNVPMPRPRPDTAGTGAGSDSSGATPIGFIQNLFH